VEVLGWVAGDELRVRLRDPGFYARVGVVCTRFEAYMARKATWASRNVPHLRRGPVAYFSAEFGLHESLRTYSGGLGLLAGDHAKSASDLGIPFVGVTLFYREGYFQQVISPDGWQHERYPAFDPLRLPLTPVLDRKGQPVAVAVEIDHATVHARAWRVLVGRAQVLLLDTNLEQNEQRFKDLTAHVYGGDQANRIGQEILLGIGGVRMLRAAGLAPSTFHMNEGHAAFLTLELVREKLKEGKPLEEAEQYARDHCVFTTHTPVPAGHDRFPRALMEANLTAFAGTLGMDMDALMRYGQENQGNAQDPFTMTALALRLSHAANGVSRLHGEVSREMWKHLYPSLPAEKVPIGAVTNGVHVTGWASPVAGAFWTRHLGAGWTDRLQDPQYWKRAMSGAAVSDRDLWDLRNRLRRGLVEFVRKRLREQHLRQNGQDPGVWDAMLSPDALTIGFARRFATYKRAPLIFRDLAWAQRLCADPKRPVQIIFAGKAHPRDDAGKHFIQQIVGVTRQEGFVGRVVFLENYDIDVARHMVAGADVWLNTPRRPMEASGTSGMKVAVNGGLHVSTMDGWWREAYDGKNGWKVGEDASLGDEGAQDEADAAALRAVLEQEVVPLFYQRGRDGLPHGWLARIRRAVATLVPAYNTDRMVAEYALGYYRPKTARSRSR
jgi:starch phosphorylase